MKIIKVKLISESTPARTHYSYPPEYDKNKIYVLAYGKINADHCCLGVIKDEALKQFIASDNIDELTREEAIELGEVWRPQIEKITDEKEVIKICKKIVKGQNLIQKEKNALDSNESTKGINKSKSFTELLDEYL